MAANNESSNQYGDLLGLLKIEGTDVFGSERMPGARVAGIETEADPWHDDAWQQSDGTFADQEPVHEPVIVPQVQVPDAGPSTQALDVRLDQHVAIPVETHPTSDTTTHFYDQEADSDLPELEPGPEVVEPRPKGRFVRFCRAAVSILVPVESQDRARDYPQRNRSHGTRAGEIDPLIHSPQAALPAPREEVTIAELVRRTPPPGLPMPDHLNVPLSTSTSLAPLPPPTIEEYERNTERNRRALEEYDRRMGIIEQRQQLLDTASLQESQVVSIFHPPLGGLSVFDHVSELIARRGELHADTIKLTIPENLARMGDFDNYFGAQFLHMISRGQTGDAAAGSFARRQIDELRTGYEAPEASGDHTSGISPLDLTDLIDEHNAGQLIIECARRTGRHASYLAHRDLFTNVSEGFEGYPELRNEKERHLPPMKRDFLDAMQDLGIPLSMTFERDGGAQYGIRVPLDGSRSPLDRIIERADGDIYNLPEAGEASFIALIPNQQSTNIRNSYEQQDSSGFFIYGYQPQFGTDVISINPVKTERVSSNLGYRLISTRPLPAELKGEVTTDINLEVFELTVEGMKRFTQLFKHYKGTPFVDPREAILATQASAIENFRSQMAKARTAHSGTDNSANGESTRTVNSADGEPLALPPPAAGSISTGSANMEVHATARVSKRDDTTDGIETADVIDHLFESENPHRNGDDGHATPITILR